MPGSMSGSLCLKPATAHHVLLLAPVSDLWTLKRNRKSALSRFSGEHRQGAPRHGGRAAKTKPAGCDLAGASVSPFVK